MILIITNKQDITSDILVRKLYDYNIDFFRFNTEDFPIRAYSSISLSNNSVSISAANKKISFQDIGSIWFRRPIYNDLESIEMSKEDKEYASRETHSFLRNLWYYLDDKLWVNHPHALIKAENKAYQLKIANSVGFKIPKTIITNDKNEFHEFCTNHNYKVIVKPISHGTYDNNQSIIFTNEISRNNYNDIDYSITISPFIIQERIEKQFDIRLTVFGQDIFAYKVIIPKLEYYPLDWRTMDMNDLNYERITPPENISQLIYDFMNRLNIHFGAFDFSISKNGDWIFLEVNPNGQFGWLELITKDGLYDSLIKLLTK